MDCFSYPQVLTYAQQSKELANVEQDNLVKRIQEFRTQAELDQLRASSNVKASTSAIALNGVGLTSDKNIDAIMQSTAKGEPSQEVKELNGGLEKAISVDARRTLAHLLQGRVLPYLGEACPKRCGGDGEQVYTRDPKVGSSYGFDTFASMNQLEMIPSIEECKARGFGN
ncbi:hypothetical protein U1Q18_043574 [Sarracenia purpurea var. burkii]